MLRNTITTGNGEQITGVPQVSEVTVLSMAKGIRKQLDAEDCQSLGLDDASDTGNRCYVITHEVMMTARDVFNNNISGKLKVNELIQDHFVRGAIERIRIKDVALDPENPKVRDAINNFIGLTIASLERSAIYFDVVPIE